MENKFVSVNYNNNNTNQQRYGNQQRQKQSQNNNNNNRQRVGNNLQGEWDRNWSQGYDNPMNGHQNPSNDPFFGWGPTPWEAYGRGIDPMRTQMMEMEQRMMKHIENKMMQMKTKRKKDQK